MRPDIRDLHCNAIPRVRATDRLTVLAARHKTRITDLTRQRLPCSPPTGELGMADLAVLERWAGPRALLAAGSARLTALIVKASHGHLGAERAREWRAATSYYWPRPASQ